MEVMPILSALRRNKVGAVLVALQIGLTLAVLANALAVIGRHWEDMTRPSGLDEANVFSITNQWVGGTADLPSRIAADVAALRSLPGVIDAEATNSFPLSGSFFRIDLRLKPDQQSGSAQTSVYFNDVHGLAAQGLRLTAGRWFTSNEIGELKMGVVGPTASVVVTAALANRLFPGGRALGGLVYLPMIKNSPQRVIGIVDRAAAGSAGNTGDPDYAAFLPLQVVDNFMFYVVRTRPGMSSAAMAVARQRLLNLSRMRVLGSAQSIAQSRRQLFAVKAATSWLLASVCALLLVITACGTVGLTMCWVAQRRRQIGMRRALGARRADILRYFHAENLIISGVGAVLGIVAGLVANLWLVNHLAVARMSVSYVLVGAAVVLGLGQLAVLWPALRAASVPPSLASRGL